MKRSLPWTIANVVVLLVFGFGIVVQFNDPDPWRWVVVYALGAAACVQELLRRGSWRLPALATAITVAWAATIVPRAMGVGFGEMVEEFEMKDLRIEEAREMWGLLIIAGWCALVAMAAWQRQRSASGTSRAAPAEPEAS